MAIEKPRESQECLFRVRNRVVLVKTKKRQPKNKNLPKTNQKTKGGFRAKWGGPLGHLTWPLNLQEKQKTKNSNKPQKNKKTMTKPKNKDDLGPSEVALWATSPDP